MRTIALTLIDGRFEVRHFLDRWWNTLSPHDLVMDPLSLMNSMTLRFRDPDVHSEKRGDPHDHRRVAVVLETLRTMDLTRFPPDEVSQVPERRYPVYAAFVLRESTAPYADRITLIGIPSDLTDEFEADMGYLPGCTRLFIGALTALVTGRSEHEQPPLRTDWLSGRAYSGVDESVTVYAFLHVNATSPRQIDEKRGPHSYWERIGTYSTKNPDSPIAVYDLSRYRYMNTFPDYRKRF